MMADRKIACFVFIIFLLLSYNKIQAQQSGPLFKLIALKSFIISHKGRIKTKMGKIVIR
jgi:hypothetical protein